MREWETRPTSLEMDDQTPAELVAAALDDSRVASLHAAVHACSPITLKPSTDDMWGSSTDSNGTTISVAPTAFPAESLYHELLHAELKLDGYCQHLTCVRVVEDETPFLLAQALDNELQHHRMFPKFEAAGFYPVRFYHDGDDQTFARVRRELRGMKPKKTSAAAYFLKYLSIIAPGGAGSEDERARLDRFFRVQVPPDKLAKVDAAAQKVQAWGAATTLDPGPVIIEIIAALGEYDGWWIGKSQDFPAAGLFTGSTFTIDEAARFAGQG